MPTTPDHHSESPPGLDVERVDWTPAEHGTLTVRVHGRWRGGSPPEGPIVLLVAEAGTRRRFDALPAEDGAPAGANWSAAFAVPAQLRPALTEGLALEAGGSEHALPGARPRPTEALEPGTGEEGEVVDRAVLAERRARRAELLEEALTRRATEAEQAVGALEDHLQGLERHLGELLAERDELNGRLAGHERELQAARAGGAEAEELRRELADARDALAAEQTRAVAAEARAATAEDRAAMLEARVADLEEHAAGLQYELAEAVEQLRAGREELGAGEAVAADRYAAAQAIAAARHRAAELESRLAAVEAARLAAPSASPPPVWAPGTAQAGGAGAPTDAPGTPQTLRSDLGGSGVRLTQDDGSDTARTVTQSDLREGLDRLGDELRGDLAAERERQGRELREVADHVRGLRDELASTMAQVRAELAARQPTQREVVAAPARPGAPLSALAQELDRARAGAPSPSDERLMAGLGQAAERLRAEAPPAEEREPGPEVPVPAREPAPVERAAFPARVVIPEDRVENEWLARAIVDLAGDEPRRAGQLVIELLPSQRLTARRTLTYDLTVEEAGAVRVHLDRGQARVERRTRPATASEEVALRIAGPAAALAPLAAGGAGRRLRGTRVEGSRRALRRLLRTRRDPVSLAELARAGDRLDPGLVLTALARAVDSAWARGSALSVAYHLAPGEPVEAEAAGSASTAPMPGPARDPDAIWIVTATGEGPLRVHPDSTPPAAAPARQATVHVPAPALTALLAREELPAGAVATVEGDVDAVALLHAWFDRVQGLPVAD